MAWTVTYFSPTTPDAAGWSTTLTKVRLGELEGFAAEAELGSVGSSGVIVDDPDGTAGHSSDAIIGLKQLYVTEALAPVGRRRIWTGYIGERTYQRGSAMFVDARRRIEPALVDLNSFLSFRVFLPTEIDATSSFNRPEETDIARVLALLGVDFLSTTLFNGLVATGTGVDMDAVDYQGQRPIDVLNDCAQQSGRNFFVFYDEAGTYTGAAGRLGLFYDFNSADVYTSSMRISNDPADVDGSTTFAPGADPRLVRDPSRVIAGVLLSYANGKVYRKLPATAVTYGWRDGVTDAPNVKTEAKANARADRYLTENSGEDDRIAFPVTVPAAHVNDWREGESAQVKLRHLPGYEAFTWMRALRRTVIQTEEGPGDYRIEYECATGGAALPPASCSTALGQIETAVATGNYSGTAHSSIVLPVSVSIAPPLAQAAVLITFACSVAGDSPTDHAMTTPTGYTLLDEYNSATGNTPEIPSGIATAVPFVLAYRAVATASGTYSAASQYSQGYGKTAWVARQLVIYTQSTSPAQHKLSYIQDVTQINATLDNGPGDGHIIIAIVRSLSGSVITPAQSGWTLVGATHATQPGGGADPPRNMQVNAYARCYTAGDGQTADGKTWRFGANGGSYGIRVSLSEWAVT